MSVYSEFLGGVQSGGLTNPYGLAAVAATGQRESGYSPANAFRQWSDPSESGQAGMAGGIMSWRAERLQGLRDHAARIGDDPDRPSPAAQASYFLNEDPALIDRLQSAGSVEEAQGLMNNAWKFAGYDRPGGEAAARIQTAREFLPRVANGEDYAGSDAVAGGQGQSMAYGGAGEDALEPDTFTPPSNPGGLGGLGGWRGVLASEGFQDTMQALGTSLMSSPSNNPFQNFGTALENQQDRRLRKEDLAERRAEKSADRQAMETVLRSQGFTAEEARAYSGNASAANLAIAQQKDARDTTRSNQTADRLEAAHPDIAGAIRGGAITGVDGWKMAIEREKSGSKAPDIVEQYDESGQPRKMVWNPQAGAYEPFGGVKAPSSGGGITVSPDGTVTVGGNGVKVPAGFMPDPDRPGAVKPIPGGPGEQISGELAARIGLADQFLKKAPALRERLAAGEASGPVDVFQARNNQQSKPAEVQRDLEFGVEALVRMLTGAGMNASEANERTRRYLPTYTDDAGSMVKKLDELTDYLGSTREMAMKGRGGTGGPAPASTPTGNRSSSGVTWSVD